MIVDVGLTHNRNHNQHEADEHVGYIANAPLEGVQFSLIGQLLEDRGDVVAVPCLEDNGDSTA